jgi:hypothetical protein
VRPRIPIAQRISNHTGISLDVVQYTLANPEPTAGPCWPWSGMIQRITPMMSDKRRPRPVRRVLFEHMHGELPEFVRVSSGCPNPFCVSPNHTLLKSKFHEGPVSLEPEPDADQNPISDVIDAVYSVDPPWDPQQLADKFDYPIHLVEEAIRKIDEEGL